MNDSNTPRVCSIEDCEAAAHCRGWCSKHYSRFKAHGDPLITKKQRYGDAQCAVADCAEPRRKREWCGSHYSRWRRTGSVADEHQAWVWGHFESCIVCSSDIPDSGEFRRYCSRTCATATDKTPRPTVTFCAKCKSPIDLLARSKSGRRKHSNVRMCPDCRAPHLQRNVPALVERDGTDCGICFESIDLAQRHPEMRSASVDHILPRSRGGADHIDNYQLAHLICNIRKQDKVGFTLTA